MSKTSKAGSGKVTAGAKDRSVSTRFETGMTVRRAVLGDAHVDRSLASADDFSWPMQE